MFPSKRQVDVPVTSSIDDKRVFVGEFITACCLHSQCIQICCFLDIKPENLSALILRLNFFPSDYNYLSSDQILQYENKFVDQHNFDDPDQYRSTDYLDVVIFNETCVQFKPILQSMSTHDMYFNYSCHFTDLQEDTHLVYSVIRVRQKIKRYGRFNVNASKSLASSKAAILLMIILLSILY
ncbi:hypothetical protein GJ496_008066 [Pomphorhynchus laevis]|nr:hypothetical protein GJ496_008066 [Pomphorhynchus laevis]